MKKLIKIMLTIIIFTLVLIPKKTLAQQQWKIDVDLSDSISSSIIKVEDGIILMQYEGSASENNLLIKYDFEGNKIWSKVNNSGYDIYEVSDGFIIWNYETIEKFDKDGNSMWKSECYKRDSRYELLEVSDGYIMYTKGVGHNIMKIDKIGNIVYRKEASPLLQFEDDETYRVPIAATTIADGEQVAILCIKNIDYYDYDYEYRNEKLGMGLVILDNNLNKIKSTSYNYEYSIFSLFDDYEINKMIETDDGYLLSGTRLVSLDKKGQIKKIYNKRTFDIIEVKNRYYIYEAIKQQNSTNTYNTVINKYNKKLEKEDTIQLPLSFTSEILDGTQMTSGFARLKNRIIYIENGDIIDSIVLNTPILSEWPREIVGSNFTIENESLYNITRYRVSENKNAEKEDVKSDSPISGIINNIVKNPQTNSIIMIVVIIIIVLIVSIVSYIFYKKQTVLNKDKKTK